METIEIEARNPLTKFSLAGQGNFLAQSAAKAEPILGKLCIKGEVGVWYAPPNTGKTLILLSLITEAVATQALAADKVFYLNADDSATGLAAKVQIADDFGIHCLAPGHKGFKLQRLVPAMREMAENGTAKGTLVVIDTLKKVADLMSKRECREFGKCSREFSMAGGTLIGLAHTNKARGKDRRLIYAGTSDILEDFDNAYLLDIDEKEGGQAQRVIRFDCIKSRGPVTPEAYYRYSTEPDLSYADRLATVQETDPTYGMQEPDEDGPEALIVGAIKDAIEQGIVTKMAIAAEVQSSVNISRRKALRVLEAFTGNNPGEHHWNFERKERGAHSFYLLSPRLTAETPKQG